MEESLRDDSSLPEATQMEVHHHPDIHHKPKPWKEYLLEFLMIFLAVTLGFFAENIREHISDRDRTAVFGKSMQEDFRADTAQLQQLIQYTNAKIENIDSLDYFIHGVRTHVTDSRLYRSLLLLISTFQFDNINGTYDQIKNTGSMRFFDQSLVNSLNRYDAAAIKLKLMEDWENKFLYEKLIPQTQTMFNYKVFDDLREGKAIEHDMYMKQIDEASVDILINQAETIKRLRSRQLGQQDILLSSSRDILIKLETEFH